MTEPMAAVDGTLILLPGRPYAPPELAAMCLEGVLRPLLPGVFISTAAGDVPAVRAAAATAVAGRRLREVGTVGRLTAAWVHGYHPPPAELELLVSRFHRLPLQCEGLRIVLHEGLLADGDVCRFGPTAVTTPLRTGVDVAFHAPPAVARRVLGRMVNSPRSGCGRAELLAAIAATGRRPGKRAAYCLVDSLPRLAVVPL